MGFEPTWGDKTPNRFRVGAVVTTSVPLRKAGDCTPERGGLEHFIAAIRLDLRQVIKRLFSSTIDVSRELDG